MESRQTIALRMGKCSACAIFLEKHWHDTVYYPAGYLYTGTCERAGQLLVTHQAMVE